MIICCSLCDVELGQAEISIKITCPSCVEVLEKAFGADKYDGTEGFDGMTWWYKLERTILKNNQFILACNRSDYDLIAAPNEPDDGDENGN